MRTPGMNLPGGFLGTISAGPEQIQAPFANGAIGTSWHTPEQAAFKAQRKKYGTLDDPDAGGYSLAQIWWDKDNGNVEVNPLEATYGGWYGPSPPVKCSCAPGAKCGCQ